MKISRQLKNAIVSTTNYLLDTNYTSEEIVKIELDLRYGGYFDVYKRAKGGRPELVASTVCSSVRSAHKELSEEIVQVLQNSRHCECIYCKS